MNLFLSRERKKGSVVFSFNDSYYNGIAFLNSVIFTKKKTNIGHTGWFGGQYSLYGLFVG